MKLSKIIIIIWVLLCSNAAVSQEKIDLKHPPIPEYYLKSKSKDRYAVLKFDPVRDKDLFGKGYKPSTVSITEIKEIERYITKQVSIYNRKGVNVIVRPGKYFKQFIAVNNAKGEKLVWINCMCEVFGSYWKKGIPLVNDGGSCFFRLKINLRKKIVYYFYTNGPG